MSVKTGNIQPQLDKSENDDLDGISAKKVLNYGYDLSAATKRRLAVDADGNQQISTINGFGIPKSDEMVLTWTGDNPTKIVFKKSTTTVATLDLTWVGDKPTRIVRS